MVSLRLVLGRKRMEPAELRPRNRQHLRRRVQFHRAGAERNHRGVETDVLSFEAADVAHHLGLGVMRVEHRVREEWRGSRKLSRQSGFGVARSHVGGLQLRPRGFSNACREGGDDVPDVVEVGRLVERHVDRAVAAVAQVDPRCDRRFDNLSHRLGATRHLEPRRIEIHVVQLPEAECRELALQQAGERPDALRDRSESAWAVIDGI